jgi:hypothetical protein
VHSMADIDSNSTQPDGRVDLNTLGVVGIVGWTACMLIGRFFLLRCENEPHWCISRLFCLQIGAAGTINEGVQVNSIQAAAGDPRKLRAAHRAHAQSKLGKGPVNVRRPPTRRDLEWLSAEQRLALSKALLADDVSLLACGLSADLLESVGREVPRAATAELYQRKWRWEWEAMAPALERP